MNQSVCMTGAFTICINHERYDLYRRVFTFRMCRFLVGCLICDSFDLNSKSSFHGVGLCLWFRIKVIV